MNRWVLDGLVALDRGLNVVPALAAHWLTPDDRTFVLELRPGLRFSDGRPVTARGRRAQPGGRQAAGVAERRLPEHDRQRARARRAPPRGARRAARPDAARAPRLGLRAARPTARERPSGARRRHGPLHARALDPGRSASSSRATRTTGAPLRPSSGPSSASCRTTRRGCGLVETGEADLADFVPPEAWSAAREAAEPAARGGRGPAACCSSACASTARPSRTRACARPSTSRSIGARSSSGCSLGKGAVGQSADAARLGAATSPSCPRRATIPERARELLRAAGLGPATACASTARRTATCETSRSLHEVARQLADVGLRVEVNALEKSALYALLARAARTSSCSAGRASRATGPTCSRCCSRRPASSALRPAAPTPRLRRRRARRDHARGAVAREPARARRRCSGARSRGSPSCARSCRSWCSRRPSSTTPVACSWDPPVSLALRPRRPAPRQG